MLLRAIENVRQKPKAVRQRYALVVAVAFTVVVTGIWSLSLPGRFTAVHDGMMTASPEMKSQTASAPFSGVWGQFKQQVLGMTGENTATPRADNDLQMMIDNSAVLVSPEPKPDSVLLESGSTIRFGTDESKTDSPAIMLGTTTGSTSVTSTEGR